MAVLASPFVFIASSPAYLLRSRLASTRPQPAGGISGGSSRRRRAAGVVVAAAPRSFKVTLHTPEGEQSLEVAEDMYIADAAEGAGVALPVSCRSGACSSCAARLKAGQVDQTNQTFLDDEQVAQGFVLTCVAYPLSDIVLETHQESLLYS